MSEGKEIQTDQQQGPMDDETVQIEIRSDAGVNSSSGSRDEWFRFIMQGGGETGNNQSQKPLIPKVPLMLSKNEVDQKYYNPSVVAIGPYHHKNNELHDGERLKVKMARQFVERSKNSIEELYNRVEMVAGRSRRCYDESSTNQFNDETFTQMMFLDGCFILQFIYYTLQDYEKLEMNDHVVASVQRDLFLLENQIPFEVLKSLFTHGAETLWMVMINDFIEDIRKLPLQQFAFKNLMPKKFSWKHIGLSYRPEKRLEEMKKHDKMVEKMLEEMACSDHLLAQLYSQSVGNENRWPHEDGRISPNCCYYYPAKELKKVGIKFKPSRTMAWTDVKYKSTFLAGILKLPPITIDESTKTMLLNLVAYEICAGAHVKPWVTAYICFMDSLINDAEDVKELRSKGILFNFLGTDEDVADLFNGMGSYLVPKPVAYIDVKMGINSQCRSRIKKWIAEFLQVYFRSPWTFIAVVAATIAIILTAIQTYLAAFPSKKSN